VLHPFFFRGIRDDSDEAHLTNFFKYWSAETAICLPAEPPEPASCTMVPNVVPELTLPYSRTLGKALRGPSVPHVGDHMSRTHRSRYEPTEGDH